MFDALSIRSDQTKLTLSITTATLGFAIALLLTESSIHDRFAVPIIVVASIVALSAVFAILALMRISGLAGKKTVDAGDKRLEGLAAVHMLLLAAGISGVIAIFLFDVFGPSYRVRTADEAMQIVMRRIGSPALVSKATVAQLRSIDSHSERATWIVRVDLKERRKASRPSTRSPDPIGYDFFIDAVSGNLTCELGAGTCAAAP